MTQLISQLKQVIKGTRAPIYGESCLPLQTGQRVKSPREQTRLNRAFSGGGGTRSENIPFPARQPDRSFGATSLFKQELQEPMDVVWKRHKSVHVWRERQGEAAGEPPVPGRSSLPSSLEKESSVGTGCGARFYRNSIAHEMIFYPPTHQWTPRGATLISLVRSSTSGMWKSPGCSRRLSASDPTAVERQKKNY